MAARVPASRGTPAEPGPKEGGPDGPPARAHAPRRPSGWAPRAWAWILGTTAVQVILNGAWLALDDGDLLFDAFWHQVRVWRIQEAMGLAVPALHDAGGLSDSRYGLLPAAALAVLSAPFGGDPAASVWVQAGVTSLLVLAATYGIAHALAGHRAGAAAVLTLACLPAFGAAQRTLLLDLPLTAAVAWTAFLCLVASARERAARRVPLLLLAAVAAAGISVKANYVAFASGPLLWLLLADLRRDPRGPAGSARGAVRRILLGSAIAGAAGAAAWTLLIADARKVHLARTLAEATWPGAWPAYRRAGSSDLFLSHWAAGAAFNAWEMGSWALHSTFSLLPGLMALAAVAAFLARPHYRGRGLLAAWAGPPVIALALLMRGRYDERYVLPLLPAVAAACGVVFAGLRPGWGRRAVTAGSAALGAATVAVVTFGAFASVRPFGCLQVDRPPFVREGYFSDVFCVAEESYKQFYRSAAPRHIDVGEGQVAALLGRLAPGRPPRVLFGPGLSLLFYRLAEQAVWGRVPLDVGDSVNLQEYRVHHPQGFDVRALPADGVVLLVPEPRPRPGPLASWADEAREWRILDLFDNSLDLAGGVEVDGLGEIRLYRVRVDPSPW
ncbi:glycosyltransferase family 39 protein [Myxococcota bacterium]|nr:glycosyltransferase family 39 protein [Myxococcota bacterium]